MECNDHGGHDFKSDCWICKAKQTLKDNEGAIERRDKVIAALAATIEALREENERLKAALDLIVNMDSQMFTLGDACSVAMKALQESNYE